MGSLTTNRKQFLDELSPIFGKRLDYFFTIRRNLQFILSPSERLMYFFMKSHLFHVVNILRGLDKRCRGTTAIKKILKNFALWSNQHPNPDLQNVSTLCTSLLWQSRKINFLKNATSWVLVTK